MRISRPTRMIVAVLVAAVLAPVAPALARVNDPVADRLQAAGEPEQSSTLVLRRDGDRAVPFVAYDSPAASTASGDGFDWGDAAIGTGAGLLIATLAMLGSGAIQDRRQRSQGRLPATAPGA